MIERCKTYNITEAKYKARKFGVKDVGIYLVYNQFVIWFKRENQCVQYWD